MANFGQGVQGALGGAATGASIGSFFPGFGTAIGGVLGGLAGGAAGLFSKTKKPFQQTPNKFNPQQQQALQQLLSQGLTGLQNPTAGFEPIEQQAQREFQSETIPGLAERFTAMGGSGTRGSSGFAGTLGGAAADLKSQLAALKSQYGMQNQQNSLAMINAGLTPQTEELYMGDQPGIGGQIAQMGGNLLGSYFQGGGDFGFGSGSNSGNKGSIFSQWSPQQKRSLFDALTKWKATRGGI